MMRPKRFLITSSDQSLWPDDLPILFLGEWCTWNVGSEVLEKLNFEVASPYGWEDGQREADYQYVWEIIERILPEISQMLNNYHATNHSQRYWRILLGTWLYKFTMILFNRWATVQNVLTKHSLSSAMTLEFPKNQMVPMDYISFARMYRFDSWNQAIYGTILKESSNISCTVKKIDFIDEGRLTDLAYFTPPPSMPLKSQVKKNIAKVAQKFSILLTKSTDAFMVSTYLPFLQEFKLYLSLGQIPVPRLLESTPKADLDINARKNLCLDSDKFSGFERFIRTLIPEHLPICYLEGYQVLCEKAKSMPWPTKPKFIFTSNSFDGDEVFKAWVASKTELGIPYMIGQHGGNYGAAKFAPSEIHEVETADRYLTWGWVGNSPKIHSVGALPLMGRPTGKYNPKGRLLLVQRGGGHREALWDETIVFRNYLEDQFKFVGLLSSQVIKKLSVRLYSAYLYANWSEDKMWRRYFPLIDLDYGTGPIGDRILQSRLIVFSYESTGVLELLAGNVPVIFFYNVNNWPIRPEAKPYYDLLIEVGIFHLSAESAAQKVNEIWDDISSWWGKDVVLKARREFCDQFVRMPQHPIRELKKALLSI